MKKKVCQIGFLKFGVGHYISHLYPYLSDEYKIKIITYTHGSPGDKLIVDDPIVTKNIKSYQQIINPHGWRESFQSLKQLFEIFEKEKFDILNLHISTYIRFSSFIFIPVIEHFKKKGLKVVYTMHDVLPFPEKETISEYLKYFYSLADAYIVGNEKEKNNLIQYFGFTKKIFIAIHGIYSMFNSGKIDKKEAEKNLGVSQFSKKILFFGALRDNKGLDDFIKALNILNQKNQDIFAIISCSVRGAVTFDKYQELINRYHLENKIKLIIKDYLYPEEIESQFKAADLVILPYTEVSQSGILNMAFAFEKPVIITDVFSEKDIVDNKMGYVVPRRNYILLAQKILEFFEEKNRNKFIINIKKYNLSHGFKETAKIHKIAFNSTQ